MIKCKIILLLMVDLFFPTIFRHFSTKSCIQISDQRQVTSQKQGIFADVTRNENEATLLFSCLLIDGSVLSVNPRI